MSGDKADVVLIVLRDRSESMTLSMALGRCGWAVAPRGTYSSAILLAQQASLAAAVLDLGLHGSAGLLASHLRAMCPALPMVLVTGSLTEPEAALGAAAMAVIDGISAGGPTAHITRPVEVDGAHRALCLITGGAP